MNNLFPYYLLSALHIISARFSNTYEYFFLTQRASGSTTHPMIGFLHFSNTS